MAGRLNALRLTLQRAAVRGGRTPRQRRLDAGDESRVRNKNDEEGNEGCMRCQSATPRARPRGLHQQQNGEFEAHGQLNK